MVSSLNNSQKKLFTIIHTVNLALYRKITFESTSKFI